MIIAYSYNDNQPRFYSKYFKAYNSSLYDVTFATASKAALSTPAYFDSYSHVNGLGVNELLIDGTVIATNPSMYAFI